MSLLWELQDMERTLGSQDFLRPLPKDFTSQTVKRNRELHPKRHHCVQWVRKDGESSFVLLRDFIAKSKLKAATEVHT